MAALTSTELVAKLRSLPPQVELHFNEGEKYPLGQYAHAAANYIEAQDKCILELRELLRKSAVPIGKVVK